MTLVFKKASQISCQNTRSPNGRGGFPVMRYLDTIFREYGRGGAPGLLLIGIGIDFGVVEIRGPPSIYTEISEIF